MKKMMVFMLVVVMMVSSSALVFANDSTAEKRTDLTKEEKRLRVIELYQQYNPDALEDFNNIIEEHKNFHEDVRAEKEIIKDAYNLKRESLKAKAESGEITKEEIKSMYEVYNEVREGFKSEVEKLKALKQAEVDANKEELAIIRKELIAEVKADDTDSLHVSSLLDQIVELLEEHLDIDIYYYNLLKDFRDNNEEQLF